MSLSCVIPCYNEETRISKVLAIIIKINTIDEIIVVDDGSTDNSVAIIKKHFPTVKIIKIDKNIGKSGAVFEGVKHAKGAYIFLLDADLVNLQIAEIENAIRFITKHKEIDMIILKRIHDPFIFKLLRGNLLLSGERIIKRSDLIEIFKDKPSHYQLETFINQYMSKNKKSVVWMKNSATTTLKSQKVGFIKGIKNDILMNLEIIKTLHHFWHILTFCKKEAPHDYV